MNRLELEEAIVRACEVTGMDRVIVVGSQAILASIDAGELPERATMSVEADIAPEVDIGEHLTTLLWLEAGQDSPWANERDYFIDAVSADTAYLPPRWRERAVELRPQARPELAGICPDPLDLCASKLARNDVKDREFVSALVDDGIISPRALRARFDEIDDPRLDPEHARVARQFIITLERRAAASD